MMNLNHLYYFYVAAQQGGVVAASRFLHLSQPSLSQQIKVFERAMGVVLFEKVGRRMRLTAQGENVFIYCKKIFELTGELETNVFHRDSQKTRPLLFAVSDQVERPFVADLLSPLLRKRGGNHQVFSIVCESEDESLARCRKAELDLLLTNHPILSEDLELLVHGEVPVYLFFHKNSSPSERRHLLLPSEKARLRHETDLFLRRKKGKFSVVMESDLLSIVVRGVLDGAGSAFLPRAYMQDFLKTGWLRMQGPKAGYWKHSFYLYGRVGLGHHSKVLQLEQEIRKRLS